MNVQVFKADTRGYANHSWLKTYHSFSFASYYNPDRMGFGKLRVLNDDYIAPGMGFGTHPHDNMEIISIPLSGTIAHKDSMGHTSLITAGEVQVMSAGTGITHSEFNASSMDELQLLQIWILPEKQNLQPRYDQKNFHWQEQKNRLIPLVGHISDGSTLGVNQDTRISVANYLVGKKMKYSLSSAEKLLYTFIISGKLKLDGETYETKDALGLSETKQVDLQFVEDSQVLFIEVPK